MPAGRRTRPGTVTPTDVAASESGMGEPVPAPRPRAQRGSESQCPAQLRLAPQRPALALGQARSSWWCWWRRLRRNLKHSRRRAQARLVALHNH